MANPRSPRCPLCGSDFNINDVDFALPFRCPSCEAYLCVPRYYSVFLGLRALLISGILCFLLGARGATLQWTTLLGWLPVLFVSMFWTRHFAPPKLKPGDAPRTDILGLSARQNDKKE